MTVIAKRAIVRGRVQGVWFRAWTVEQARALGLAGWVRNRSNGDVEALIEGEAEAVERMIGLLWDGSPAARVEAVDIIDQPVGAFTAFEQLPTG